MPPRNKIFFFRSCHRAHSRNSILPLREVPPFLCSPPGYIHFGLFPSARRRKIIFALSRFPLPEEEEKKPSSLLFSIPARPRGEDLAMCAKWNDVSFSPALSVDRGDWREGGITKKSFFVAFIPYPVCGKSCAECEIIYFPSPG